MTQKVLEDIYALSALQGYVNLPDRERALLNEDQMEGLMVLVEDAWVEMVMELMPRIEDYGMPSVGTGGSMWMQIKVEYGISGMEAGPVARMAQRTLAYIVLGAIYETSAEGTHYARRGAKGVEMIREIIDSGGWQARLTGYR